MKKMLALIAAFACLNVAVYADGAMNDVQGAVQNVQGQNYQVQYTPPQDGSQVRDMTQGMSCPADAPCADQPVGDCYCKYVHYEPCYYYTCNCEQCPQYYCERACRMVPQNYCVTRCRYVPQYYQEQCCRYVPQYYYVQKCRYCPKYTYEKHCTYTPKYYYKHTCEPTCGAMCQPCAQ